MSAHVHGLFHVAVKTPHLTNGLSFYQDMLGLEEFVRSGSGYPGAWLGCPGLGGTAIVHLYAGGPAPGTNRTVCSNPAGSAVTDHTSLPCSGFQVLRERSATYGLQWREFLAPGTTLWHLFAHDPSSVQLELTFAGMLESGALPDLSDRRACQANVSLFEPANHA